VTAEFAPLLAKLLAGELDADEVRAAFDAILAGSWTPIQTGAFAVALRMRGETDEQIVAAARAMRAAMSVVDHGLPMVLDTCGTGGDGAHTLNISSAAAIVVAACDVPVAKHGNRSVSSRTGSADVLESLGVGIDLTPADAGRSLDVLGITFLFAPNYHGALRHAVGPRRELGVRTVFNVLGPLTNPAGASRQLLGVYADALVPLIAQVLNLLGSERAMIVHGLDGLDELTVFARNHVAELADGRVREFELDPADFGLAHHDRSEVAGGTAAENAARVRAVLGGEPGAARDIVVLNSAAALVVAGVAPDLREGIERARAAIDSGAAARKLDDLAAFRG